jgi:hypothetical protein
VGKGRDTVTRNTRRELQVIGTQAFEDTRNKGFTLRKLRTGQSFTQRAHGHYLWLKWQRDIRDKTRLSCLFVRKQSAQPTVAQVDRHPRPSAPTTTRSALAVFGIIVGILVGAALVVVIIKAVVRRSRAKTAQGVVQGVGTPP